MTDIRRQLRIIREVKRKGLSPLDYMIGVVFDPDADSVRRDAMAVAALPYTCPRLITQSYQGLKSKQLEAAKEAIQQDGAHGATFWAPGTAGSVSDLSWPARPCSRALTRRSGLSVAASLSARSGWQWPGCRRDGRQ